MYAITPLIKYFGKNVEMGIRCCTGAWNVLCHFDLLYLSNVCLGLLLYSGSGLPSSLFKRPVQSLSIPLLQFCFACSWNLCHPSQQFCHAGISSFHSLILEANLCLSFIFSQDWHENLNMQCPFQDVYQPHKFFFFFSLSLCFDCFSWHSSDSALHVSLQNWVIDAICLSYHRYVLYGLYMPNN